jgi:hypothetical protein
MATTGAGMYRPRHPERTVLYRVLAQHFERFVQVYDERFAPTQGPLPAGAQEAVNRYLDCGIFASGFARVRCNECGHDCFVAFSCKLRCFCPSCHMKRELIWADWAGNELLEDVPHRQLPAGVAGRSGRLRLAGAQALGAGVLRGRGRGAGCRRIYPNRR